MKLTVPFGTSISPPTRFGPVLCTPVVQPENPEASIEIAPRKTVPGAPHIFRVGKDMCIFPVGHGGTPRFRWARSGLLIPRRA